MMSVGEVNDYIIREMLSVHEQNWAAGIYHIKGDVADKSLQTEPGRKRMAVLQLHKGTPGLGLEEATHLVEEIFDGHSATVDILEAAMRKATSHPNVEKPYRKSETAGEKAGT
jgi:ribosomal protein L7/L12